jgi:UDPglucose--hexose-1-phosphate uridylyltransferase
VLALPDGGREPNTPGWTVRVVPNLYPALERQEVVIHSPRHVRSFAELGDEEVETVAAAWTARAAGVSGYVHALVNEGRAGGGSLPHSHSQLAWFREPPPAVAAERADGLGKLFREAIDRGLGVDGAEDLVVVCHPVGRLPYETVIMSDSAREPWPGRDTLSRALKLLRNTVGRLRSVEGAVPWNAWLHHGREWHIELVPRLSILAGLELGAGIYVNALLPEDAARALREA